MILGFNANLMSILAFLSSPEPIKDYLYLMRRPLVYIVTLCTVRNEYMCHLQYIVSNISRMKSGGAHVSTSCHLKPGLIERETERARCACYVYLNFWHQN